MPLSIPQCRAARALLGWSASKLAETAGISALTVKRFEGGQAISTGSLAKLVQTLDYAGIVLIDEGTSSAPAGPGVRLRD
ncbi:MULTISPECIES: helix-turn-helix domain-containing protein [unclassified Sphingomonas]|uniref:helix-turn-helix domain-containing protein n=1 Tax=unclassified Sphingomonas TaxID=196159 RepID=UPI003FA6A55E